MPRARLAAGIFGSACDVEVEPDRLTLGRLRSGRLEAHEVPGRRIGRAVRAFKADDSGSERGATEQQPPSERSGSIVGFSRMKNTKDV